MRRWQTSPARAAAAAAGAVFILLTLSAASPSRAANEYTILGAGSRPCGSWLRLRSQAAADSVVLQSWVLGYLTGINANVLTLSADVTAGTAPEALFSWIDGYCAAHPLDSLARATGALLDSLRAKNGAR